MLAFPLLGPRSWVIPATLPDPLAVRGKRVSRWHLWDQKDKKLAVAMLQHLRVRLVDGEIWFSVSQGYWLLMLMLMLLAG